MDILTFKSTLLDNCSYCIVCRDTALIIDTIYEDNIIDELRSMGIENVTIVLTHEHCDHLLGIKKLREHFKCTVICQRDAAIAIKDCKKNLSAYFEFLTMAFEDKGQKLEYSEAVKPFVCEADEVFDKEVFLRFGEYEFKFISTPGHSKGSICIVAYKDDMAECLFTGDSLLKDYPTYTNLPGGSKKVYNSITRSFLESFNGDIMVYPGHGECATLSECMIK